MNTRTLVALALGFATIIVMSYVLASVTTPPLSAASPSTWHRVAEAEFQRLPSAGNSVAILQTPVAIQRPKPNRTPRPVVAAGFRVSLTWFCLPGVSRCTRGYPSGHYAAASPDLLAKGWRGERVRVCWGGACTTVTVIDCSCQAFRSLDLYSWAFADLADLGRGRLRGASAGLVQ